MLHKVINNYKSCFCTSISIHHVLWYNSQKYHNDSTVTEYMKRSFIYWVTDSGTEVLHLAIATCFILISPSFLPFLYTSVISISPRPMISVYKWMGGSCLATLDKLHTAFTSASMSCWKLAISHGGLLLILYIRNAAGLFMWIERVLGYK